MKLEPWHFAAMEAEGILDTHEGLINRAAKFLSHSANSMIGEEEFRTACYACDVDPNSFTQADVEQIEQRLNEISR